MLPNGSITIRIDGTIETSIIRGYGSQQFLVSSHRYQQDIRIGVAQQRGGAGLKKDQVEPLYSTFFSGKYRSGEVSMIIAIFIGQIIELYGEAEKLKFKQPIE